MEKIRGCNLPEDCYYFAEKHVWARPVEGSLVRVGMDAVAGQLSGGKLNAVTVRAKNIGAEIPAGTAEEKAQKPAAETAAEESKEGEPAEGDESPKKRTRKKKEEPPKTEGEAPKE